MATERPPEPVRLAIELTQAALAPLSAEQRTQVLGCLDFVASLLDKVAELKAHNEQRHEEVWAARELLGARPNETLPMAIERRLSRPCALGMHQFPPGELTCTCGREIITYKAADAASRAP
jgi:hypothetical protein